MRIIFDARGVREQSDGLSNYVRHVLSWLLRTDQENHYTVLASPAMRDYLRAEHLEELSNSQVVVSRCPFMGPIQQLCMPARVRWLPQADLYHYPHFDLPIFAHPRSIVTIHDLNHLTMEGYFRSHKHLKRFYSARTTAMGVAKAKSVLAVSLATKAQLLATFPWLNAQKVVVIYEGPGETFAAPIDSGRVKEFRGKYHLGSERYLLYVGTDRPHKNLVRLLEAYAKVCRLGGGIQRLLLVGPLQAGGSVEQTILRLGLDSQVRRVGYLSDAELPLAYQVADAFAFCSLAEGFGIPLVEAMVSSVPIVTSNLSATAEVVADCAVLVDPYSIDSIAEGLKRLLSSEDLRHTLVARARLRMAQFSWEKAARRTLEVYQEVGGIFPVKKNSEGQNLQCALAKCDNPTEMARL
ncbi:MAG: glycosyltransferase family 4 protein [Candidatus Omnitrophica bacterium]|nr:glycosyltransferase family 4 protein [Candidatus Omnitrophota bacterium]MBI3010600.1 glycosyltransferase family 4 protein [Candidatus Omnitrophota bacterium]